jgi:hypothetical protein
MFIQSRVARGYALGTVDGNDEWLLPTNPVSHIDISIQCLTAAANLADNLLTLAGQLQSVQVLYRGTQIVALSGDDLVRLTNALGLHGPRLYNPAVADNSPRALTLRIPFGRKLFNPAECLPSSQKGDLTLFLQWDAVTTSYDGIVLNISTYELPNANPKQFIRYTTLTDTPAATGDKDYDLPRIAPISGLGFFQTNSYPANATPTINTIKVLLNNLDTGYTDLDSVMARDISPYNDLASNAGDFWIQQENSAAAYTQNAVSIANHYINGPSRDFMYLDYDPYMDGLHLLDGPKATELKARVNFGSTTAIRIIPVELFTPSMLPGRRA